MAKGTSQEGRSQHSVLGLESLPGMDPATFAANLEPFFQAGTKVLENWRVVSEELMEFGKSRLTRNIECGRKVTACTSFDQAIEAQAEFCRSAMQDYIAESSKLAELGTRAMMGSLSAWQFEKRPAQRAAQTEVETTEAITTKRSVAAE